jgi:hypothetical protein
MRNPSKRFTRIYGGHPLHLLALMTCFAFVGYVVSIVGTHELWHGHKWWQTILVWFVGAIVLHDMLLFPLYTLADRSLGAGWRAATGRLPETHVRIAPLNYLRVPLLASGLLFLLYFPGIIEQGSRTYSRATGLTQGPFLSRYLLIIAALFGLSAVSYAMHTLRSNARSNGNGASAEESGLNAPRAQ